MAHLTEALEQSVSEDLLTTKTIFLSGKKLESSMLFNFSTGEEAPR